MTDRSWEYNRGINDCKLYVDVNSKTLEGKIGAEGSRISMNNRRDWESLGMAVTRCMNTGDRVVYNDSEGRVRDVEKTGSTIVMRNSAEDGTRLSETDANRVIDDCLRASRGGD